jgi:hypothetical protein
MTQKELDSLRHKVEALVRENKRLYKMLDQCLLSRERLQVELANLLVQLTDIGKRDKPGLSDDERR